MIVVDDGGSFRLDAVVKTYEKRVNLALYRQENAGPAAARNTAARHARGTFLAFMDDDCRPHKAWLKAFEEQLEKYPGALLGGKTVNFYKNNLYAAASQQIVTFLYRWFQARNSAMSFFTSNNMVVPAKKFHEIGGFNTVFALAAAEDREFCSNWLFSGGSMVYVPCAVMGHAHALTFKSYLRQHVNYGRGGFFFNRIEKQRRGRGLKIAPFSFYISLLRAPWQGKGRGCRIKSSMISGLIFLSQAANALGFFYEKFCQKR